MKMLVSLRPVFFGALLLTSVLTSADVQARKIECHAGENIRIIETRYPPKDSNVACNVTYHKPTEGVTSQELWSARNDAEYCGNKAWLLANKLEANGWTCNSIYEATPANQTLSVSRRVNDRDISNAPTSPLAFREFLADEFGVVFQTQADYRYNENEQTCITTGCKRFFEYRSQLATAPVAFFGRRVTSAIKLWMDLQCNGSHCWGHLYKEQEQEQEQDQKQEAATGIEKLALPEFETGAAFNIFLKSKNAGFPDLWLPISHSDSNVVEVRLLRYQDGSYQTLAHLLAKPAAELQALDTGQSALQPGIVTLTAKYAGDSLKLVYETPDIDYEGLLFDPRK